MINITRITTSHLHRNHLILNFPTTKNFMVYRVLAHWTRMDHPHYTNTKPWLCTNKEQHNLSSWTTETKTQKEKEGTRGSTKHLRKGKPRIRSLPSRGLLHEHKLFVGIRIHYNPRYNQEGRRNYPRSGKQRTRRWSRTSSTTHKENTNPRGLKID